MVQGIEIRTTLSLLVSKRSAWWNIIEDSCIIMLALLFPTKIWQNTDAPFNSSCAWQNAFEGLWNGLLGQSDKRPLLELVSTYWMLSERVTWSRKKNCLTTRASSRETSKSVLLSALRWIKNGSLEANPTNHVARLLDPESSFWSKTLPCVQFLYISD